MERTAAKAPSPLRVRHIGRDVADAHAPGQWRSLRLPPEGAPRRGRHRRRRPPRRAGRPSRRRCSGRGGAEQSDQREMGQGSVCEQGGDETGRAASRSGCCGRRLCDAKASSSGVQEFCFRRDESREGRRLVLARERWHQSAPGIAHSALRLRRATGSAAHIQMLSSGSIWGRNCACCGVGVLGTSTDTEKVLSAETSTDTGRAFGTPCTHTDKWIICRWRHQRPAVSAGAAKPEGSWERAPSGRTVTRDDTAWRSALTALRMRKSSHDRPSESRLADEVQSPKGTRTKNPRFRPRCRAPAKNSAESPSPHGSPGRLQADGRLSGSWHEGCH